MDPLRVLVADDHILFRKGVITVLKNRPGIEVVGEASDGEEAVTRAQETLPDVILMDINMPITDGLEATRRIKRTMPHVHIIMLTVSGDDAHIFAAIKSGAEGYLNKDVEPTELYEKLEGIRRGEAALSGQVAAKILQEFRQPNPSPVGASETKDELTPREIEILELVTEGASNKEIAERLFIAENTVKIHLRNILDKLHLQNRIQAAVYAVRQKMARDASNHF